MFFIEVALMIFSRRLRFFWACVITYLLVLGLFHYSLVLGVRQDGYDISYWTWTTCSNLKYARNWHEEGALTLGFGMFEYPPSVEFQELSHRMHYNSYPPGYVFPTYITGKILGRPPDEFLMAYLMRLNFLLTGVLISITGLLIARRVFPSPLAHIPLAVLAAAMHLLNPATYRMFDKYYSPDMAVLPFFGLVILLELMHDQCTGKRKLIDGLLAVTLFMGAFTEWIFVFLAFTLFTKRMMKGEVPLNFRGFARNSARLWTPITVAVIIWLAITVYHGNPERLAQRYRFSGFQPGEGKNLGGRLFDLALIVHEGYAGGGTPKTNEIMVVFTLILAAGYAAARLVFKKPGIRGLRELFLMEYVILAPSIMHSIIFIEHALRHEFTIAKYTFAFSLIPFLLAPAMVVKTASPFFPGLSRFRLRGVGIMIAAIVLFMGVSHIHDQIPKFEYKGGNYAHKVWQAKFIGENTGYSDYCVSKEYIAIFDPPQALWHTQKPVYRLSNDTALEDVCHDVKFIREEYTVNIISVISAGADGFNVTGKLGEDEYRLISSKTHDLNIYKISKPVFRAFCRRNTNITEYRK